MSESVGLGSLGETGFTRGADLDGVLVAKKEILSLAVRAELGEMLGNKIRMTETAFTDMFRNGGERDDDSRMVSGGKTSIENLGERASESAGGIELEIVNELAD